MKHILLLSLLFILGCTYSPKYIIGEKVEVKSGFFKGCTGIVSSFYPALNEYGLTRVACVRTEITVTSILEFVRAEDLK
jgi:transcription antitermination factor NusG